MLQILLLLAALALAFACYYRVYLNKFRHWERLGVPQIPDPKFPSGSWGAVLSGKKQARDEFRENYEMFRGSRCYGAYLFRTPVLCVRDPVSF